MWPRIAAALALAAAVGATALVVAGPARVVGDGCGQPFDRAAFRDPDERQDEAGRIARCDLLDGWPERRVRARLGAPDEAGPEGLRYVVGSVGWTLPDGQELIVTVDGRGRVAGTELLRPDYR